LNDALPNTRAPMTRLLHQLAPAIALNSHAPFQPNHQATAEHGVAPEPIVAEVRGAVC
jgi:hypothetical protein